LLYKFYLDKHIKFICDIDKYDDINVNYTIKIKKIYYNNKEVIKYKDINYPFKYLIPATCLHFIYKQNEIYNIVFFIYEHENENENENENKNENENENENKKKQVNGELRYEENKIFSDKYINGIYSFRININTNFLIDLSESKMQNRTEYKKWIDIIYYTNGINKYNILYLNNLNVYPNMDKYRISFDNKIDIEKTNKYDIVETKEKIDDFNKIKNESKKKAYIKLQRKILEYKIIDKEKIKEKIEKFRDDIQNEINNFTIGIDRNSIKILLEERYNFLYDYLLNIKINNFFVRILRELKNGNIKNFIDLIKINIDMFDTKINKFYYNFEILFEFVSGMELLDEQMKKYIDIINNYNSYNSTQNYNEEKLEITNKNIFNARGGGNKKMIYPLHHFMMGKGKTKVLTPMLMLYFIFIHKKHIIIVIPPHLENSLRNDLSSYIQLFDIGKNINIFTDNDIKNIFLEEGFNNYQKNKEYILLIDEFDNLLDPLYSNYNIIEKKKSKCNEKYEYVYSFIKNIINNHIKIKDNQIILPDTIKIQTSDYNDIYKLILRDIENIIDNINNNKLQYNINWGIDTSEYFAIPYRTKDKPLINSKFTSYINTIFLTLYYYKIINPHITEDLIKYIKINNLYDHLPITKENITVSTLNTMNTEKTMNRVIEHIISEIEISNEQKNTSFVDIINIENMYKIGYSGTLNIDLPQLESDKFEYIEKDYDEKINVRYAIYNSNISYSKNKDRDNILSYCLKYDAFIDVIGVFKDYKNLIYH
jgi:hypothetical protein